MDNFIVEGTSVQQSKEAEPATELPSSEPEVKVEPEAEPKEPVEVEPKPKKSRAQERIRTLTQEKYDLLRQLEEAKSVKKEVELDPEDFADYDEYKAELENTKPKEVKKGATQKDDSQFVVDLARENFETAREKYDDFDDLVEAMPVLTVDMLRALNESDDAGEIAYYLSKNPKEARELSKLSPYKMAIEVGKIEVKLSQPKVDKPIVKKVTTAQEPIEPIGGSNAPSRSVYEAETLGEYEAMRAAQTRKSNGWV